MYITTRGLSTRKLIFTNHKGRLSRYAHIWKLNSLAIVLDSSQLESFSMSESESIGSVAEVSQRVIRRIHIRVCDLRNIHIHNCWHLDLLTTRDWNIIYIHILFHNLQANDIRSVMAFCHPKNENGPDWQYGLCGCFQNCGLCIYTFFCPCMVFGK